MTGTKSIKFKLIGGVFAVACAVCLGIGAAGCSSGESVDIDDAEIRLTASADGTRISWDATAGMSYIVERAPSRYSSFMEVDDYNGGTEYLDRGERYAYYRVTAIDSHGEEVRVFDAAEDYELFGTDTIVLSPEDNGATATRTLDRIYEKQKGDEFSKKRYAYLLKEGEYAQDLDIKTGYYITVAGLSENPNGVSIASLENKDRYYDGGGHNALTNFWRGVENLTVRSDTVWAVSQGAYMRSVKITGNLALSDGSGYASGGFLSDSFITGKVSSGAQQQWLTRNSGWGSWEGGVWNMCFAGVDNAPAGKYPSQPFTVEATTSVREKPFLVFDEVNGYRIAVPALREDAKGCSWSTAASSDRIERYIEMDDIYFARADRDTATTINAAIASGYSVVLSAGIYNLDEPIKIEQNGTVLLGTGLATLCPTGGKSCLEVTGCNDVTVAGILFDAGPVKSNALAVIGSENGSERDIRLHDCFFRVGGASRESTGAVTCLKVFADDSLLDNLWIWRADHGSGVGWNINDSDTGAEIYGDNVTAYCLMVEHFKKHNVVWNGDGGKIFFYQSEIAYDVLAQNIWMDGSKKGYASIKVGDTVTSFTASGLGIYSNFHNAGIELDSAIIVPDAKGVFVEHVVTVCLNNQGSINYPVNNTGDKVTEVGNPARLVSYGEK